MTISSFQAAKTLCSLLNWELTNLKLHKILYISHLLYLGEHESPLINEQFEAWDYGPVLPKLYHELKFFGSDPIINIFGKWQLSRDTPEYEMLKGVSECLRTVSAGQLVTLTHRKEGAWAKCYKGGQRNIIIPNQLILNEYKATYAQ